MNLLIRQANFSDLEILNQYLPTNIPHFHKDKIRQQERVDSWKIINKNGIEEIESEICSYLIKRLNK